MFNCGRVHAVLLVAAIGALILAIAAKCDRNALAVGLALPLIVATNARAICFIGTIRAIFGAVATPVDVNAVMSSAAKPFALAAEAGWRA